MLSIKEHSYHPYPKPLLEFSIQKNFSSENFSYNLLENLDLYFQPVEHPATAISLFAARFLLLVFGELSQIRLFKMVRREKGLVDEVTQFYCMTAMACYPIFFGLATITDFIHPLNEIIGQWVCIMGRIVVWFHFNVSIFHSFAVAILRYIFIVHEEKVKRFGKQKTKSIFLYLTIFFPITLIVWGFVENQEIDQFMFIDRCYGIDHKVFLAESTTTGKNLFCVFSDIAGSFGYIINIIRTITCFTKAVIAFVLGMNFSEALIYYKIFSHMTRFDFVNFIIIITLLNDFYHFYSLLYYLIIF